MTESPFPTVPVSSAVVRTSIGLTATTTTDGQFLIDGLQANDEIQIAKEGFETLVQPLQLDGHRQVQFQLRRSGPPPNYAGTYRLTIGDPGSCAMLPAEARQRSYTATVTQDWPFLSITLSGADFPAELRPEGNTFRGQVHDPNVKFDISVGWMIDGYPWPQIIERLPDGRFFVVAGQASGSLSNAGMSGTMFGELEIYAADLTVGGVQQPLIRCTSRSHPFTLSR